MAEQEDPVQQMTALLLMNTAMVQSLVLVLKERQVLRPAQLKRFFDLSEDRLRQRAAAPDDAGAAALALALLQWARRDTLDG